MVFKNLLVLVLWTKVALALVGLNFSHAKDYQNWLSDFGCYRPCHKSLKLIKHVIFCNCCGSTLGVITVLNLGIFSQLRVDL